jgi:hypothetical protein
VRRRPPDHNFVNWDRNTFTRLIAAPPERLVSRFQVSHAMLLNVLSRAGDGCRGMQRLIRDCHEPPKAKATHRRRAWQLFRSLLDRHIVEIVGPAPGRKLRVNVELQDDFSMDQTLSLYLIETIPLVNPEQPDYALVVISLVESILENPEIILRKQLDKLKGRKVAELKAAGMEYDERMEELEKLEHPKPNREFIYSTFNAFADRHPWVGQEAIRPKSIAREMFESFRSFADYIRDYELQRSEGLLLRHLNSVYKVLAQTVPDAAKNDTLREMELYLGTMIRQVDSSLLDEWEKMRDPDYARRLAAKGPQVAGVDRRPPGAEAAAADITRDTKAFTAAIRNRIFTFLRGWVMGDFDQALAGLSEDAHPPTCSATEDEGRNGNPPWTVEQLQSALDRYLAEHEHLCLDPEARNIRHTYVAPSEDKRSWRVQQMLVDPEGHNDWVADFEVDLEQSKATQEPVLRLRKLGSLA